MKKLLFVLLLAVLGSAQAATVTYNYVIIGDVLLGEESFGGGSNEWGLDGNFGLAGDQITATGTFTADLGTIGNETGVVSLSAVGNTLSIDMNGAGTLLGTDDTNGAGPELEFLNGQLVNFDFETDSFNFSSFFLDFTNGAANTMVGEWRSNVTLTPAVVPVPAAVWLFGSAIGLIGLRRRKTA